MQLILPIATTMHLAIYTGVYVCVGGGRKGEDSMSKQVK